MFFLYTFFYHPFLETSCKYHWAIESLRFLQLKGVKSKKLIGNFTEEECVLACLNEAQFICRSASYNFQTNECSLNQHDRHTSPQVFKRISNPNLYYFENQCINGKLNLIIYDSLFYFIKLKA